MVAVRPATRDDATAVAELRGACPVPVHALPRAPAAAAV
jgi:hypothetical protein